MTKKAQQKLGLLHCEDCGRLYSNPKYLCISCHSCHLKALESEGKGTIFTYTRIHVPFEEFGGEVPLLIGEIMLDEGIVHPGRIICGEEQQLKIGSPVIFNELNRDMDWFSIVTD